MCIVSLQMAKLGKHIIIIIIIIIITTHYVWESKSGKNILLVVVEGSVNYYHKGNREELPKVSNNISLCKQHGYTWSHKNITQRQGV